MDSKWETTYTDLDNVVTISRGDSSRMLKYLKQFIELISDRLIEVRNALDLHDRVLIRQILHKMSPQLQFFGIKDVSIPIQRLEFEYESMPFLELEVLVNDIIVKLEDALEEISKLIDSNFEKPS
jgi:HPt (histidine-containing phosphotransfer) domain-containing protein